MNTPALLTGMSRRPNRSSTTLMIGSAVLHTPSGPAPHRSLVRARHEQPCWRPVRRPYRQVGVNGALSGAHRAAVINPTTADQAGARPYIYALPLLARTPASATYRA